MKVMEKPHWATSSKALPIGLFSSSEATWQKGLSPLLLIGGIHGDEPEGVALAQNTLAWLQEEGEEKVTQPWLLIPCLNPDGFEQNQRVNGNGVDLNRNYPSSNWSAQFEQERYNPGPYPGSEPEIKALVELIQKTKPRLIIHCHSWNPCIICTGDSALDEANKLGECSGYEVRNEIGYPTPGSLSHYGWHDHKIPVICIEEAENTPLEQVWPHFEKGIKAIFCQN